MHTIRQDISYPIRTFLKRSVFTGIAILTLTLSIGVNVAVFAMVSSVVLAPLNYPQSKRLVTIRGLGRLPAAAR